MKRLDPKEVVELFKKYNVKPAQGKYYSCNRKEKCACAVGILTINMVEQEERFDFKSLVFEFSDRIPELGFGDSYIIGLIRGFDNNIGKVFDHDKNKEEVLAGYEDGKAIYGLCVEEGLV